MSVLSKLASSQNRRDEAPNQALARDLARSKDKQGIRELAEGLTDPNKALRHDCLKVLYEVGHLEPELVTGCVDEFLDAMESRDNRMAWGGMIALSTVARLKADALFPHRERIQRAMANGSVITVDNGVKTLALIASAKPEYAKAILPFLVKHLETCRPKEVPQHAESTMVAVDGAHAKSLRRVLEARLPDLTPTQAKRVNRLLRGLQ